MGVLPVIIQQLAQVTYLADSSSEGDGAGFVVAFAFIAGFCFFFFVWKYYRNANARFKFEEQTSADAKNVQGTDVKVNTRRGLSSSSISGRNDSDATARVPVEELWPTPNDAITSVLDEASGGPVGAPGHHVPGQPGQPPSSQPPGPVQGPTGQQAPYQPGHNPGPQAPFQPTDPPPYQPGQ